MRHSFCSVVLAVLLAATGLAAPAKADETLVTIGAAPLGGTYYPAALAIAEIINKHVPQMEARVEITGGTMENPALMQQGELQFGLANADVAYFAHQGQPPFNSPLTKICALFSGLAPGVVQYVVLEESGITSIKELVGKRVAVGPQGNSSGLLFAKILDFYGIKPADVTRSFVSFADGINELLDGHVDMAIVQAGLPAPGLQEAFAGSRAIRILSFPLEERDAFLALHPYYLPVTITQNEYPKLPGDVVTLATQNMVLAHADLSDATVHAVAKAIFEHLPELYAAHPSLRSVTLENASRAAIPFHPGAERYFQEASRMPDK